MERFKKAQVYLEPTLMLGVGLIILVAMTHWGRTAHPGPLFWFGVAALTGLLLGFGLLPWWGSLPWPLGH
jgi:hypothetical protein